MVDAAPGSDGGRAVAGGRPTARGAAFLAIWLLIGVALLAGAVVEFASATSGHAATATIRSCRLGVCVGTLETAGLGNPSVTVHGAAATDVGRTIDVRVDGARVFVPSRRWLIAFGLLAIVVLVSGVAVTAAILKRRTETTDVFVRPVQATRGVGAAARSIQSSPGTLAIVLVLPLCLLFLGLVYPSQFPFFGLAAVAMLLLLLFGAVADASEDGRVEAFAARGGLEYAARRVGGFIDLPATPKLIGTFSRSAQVAVRGAISGGPIGLLIPRPPGSVGRYARTTPPPLVLYNLAAAGSPRAGATFAVEIKKGEPEVVAGSDAAAAATVLTPDFASWAATDGPTAFEVSGGWLFVRGEVTDVTRDARLDALARRAAHVAAHLIEPEHDAASPAPGRQRFATLADQLEDALQRHGYWSDAPAPAVITGAFGAGSVTILQWLQYVLCDGLRTIAAGNAEPPDSSNVAAAAIREGLERMEGGDELISILTIIDQTRP